MPRDRGVTSDSSSVWLTFKNSNSLSEDRIRSLFEAHGGIGECDGAVNEQGWVMVSVDTTEKANKAIQAFKSSGNPIGSTISIMNSMENGTDSLAANIKIVTKRAPSQPKDNEKFENPKGHGGSNELLSSHDFGEVGGMKSFSAVNSKILELVSHNNNLLLERMRETVEDCNRQLKEKDDQIRRLQNIMTNQEENIRKLTNKVTSSQELDVKVKKFFGENEDYHKKKVVELTKQNQDLAKRLEESEKSRFEKVLEESDSSKVRGEVDKLASISDNILSKTEQVFAVLQGMDLGTVTRSDGRGGEVRMDTSSGNTALLHNKIDKSIRILAETSENQKKMNKVLTELIKYNGIMKQDMDSIEVEEEKKKKKEKKRDRSRGRKRSRSRSTEKRRRSRSGGSGDRVKMQQVMPPSTLDHEYEEMKWGLNMTLIGDAHWKSFMSVDDIRNVVERMGKKVNFKVMCNESETLAGMYEEERDSLMIQLPKNCFKVGISIGSNELNDTTLLTLKDAPMDEVRRRNEPKLSQRARILKGLVLNLIRQNKQVIVMIPPHGETRVEVHTQWEEILLNKLRDIRFPAIKILNMAQIMRGTMSEFANETEYLDMWLRETPTPRRNLSPYGTRRMFHALRQTVCAKTLQKAGMDNWASGQGQAAPPPPPAAASMSHHHLPPPRAAAPSLAAMANPRQEDFNCPRCTRSGHTSDHCKSKDKLCRRCGNIGHFIEVHDVEDLRYRQVITKTLGIDLWDQKKGGGYDQNSRGEDDYHRMRRGGGDQMQDVGGGAGGGAGYYGGRGGDYY